MPTGVYLHKKGYKRPPFSKEWKENISKAHKGKPNNFAGKKHTEETKQKIRDSIKKRFPNGRKQELHPQWRGDDVGYVGLHIWVATQKGKPKKCEHCGTTTAKRFEWASKSRECKRDIDDWIRLCTKCHSKYDGVSENMSIKMKGNQNFFAKRKLI